MQTFPLTPLAIALGSVLLSLSAQAQETVTLGTVAVTAKGYAADTLATSGAVESLVPRNDSGVAGGLFTGEPGMASHSDGAWGQNPVLRGLKKESVVVLVDGVRVNLEASVTNLLRKGYHDHLTEGLPREEIQAPGRSLNMSLKGRF